MLLPFIFSLDSIFNPVVLILGSNMTLITMYFALPSYFIAYVVDRFPWGFH